jgi:hypothetical protein
MDGRAATEPDPDDWFIVGRVYEAYGELAAAETAYRKALTRQEKLPPLDSAVLLAQRRLEAMRPK